MTEIRFYHLERQTLDQALPLLLGKAMQGGRRVVLKTPHENETERLNAHLWMYKPESFIPHGSAKDGHAAQQPLWLTDQDENPNGAGVLILVQGAQSAMIGDFDLVCDMLDGTDAMAVSDARTRWKTYKDAGHQVTYWQQGTQGWEKKA